MVLGKRTYSRISSLSSQSASSISQRVGIIKSKYTTKPSTKALENTANEQILLEQEITNQENANKQLVQVLQYIKEIKIEHKEENKRLAE